MTYSSPILIFFIGSVILSVRWWNDSWSIKFPSLIVCVKLCRKNRDSRNNSGMVLFWYEEKKTRLENLNDVSFINMFNFCWSEYNKSMKWTLFKHNSIFWNRKGCSGLKQIVILLCSTISLWYYQIHLIFLESLPWICDF